MIFTETSLAGAFIVDVERLEDERGFFSRTFCSDEFEGRGLESSFVQCNVSFNRFRGTIRGLHFQSAPHEETKLVRCSMGAIWDVIVDIREASGTFAHWFAVELSAENRRAVYVPGGFAHGFQTLTDDVEVMYQMSTKYAPHSAGGIRFDDPQLAVRWPLPPQRLSDRDLVLPMLRELDVIGFPRA